MTYLVTIHVPGPVAGLRMPRTRNVHDGVVQVITAMVGVLFKTRTLVFVATATPATALRSAFLLENCVCTARAATTAEAMTWFVGFKGVVSMIERSILSLSVATLCERHAHFHFPGQ